MSNDVTMEVTKAFEVLVELGQHGTENKIYSLNREAFMSFIGTLVDSYGAANSMSSEDTLKMMNKVIDVMTVVHAELGVM